MGPSHSFVAKKFVWWVYLYGDPYCANPIKQYIRCNTEMEAKNLLKFHQSWNPSGGGDYKQIEV